MSRTLLAFLLMCMNLSLVVGCSKNTSTSALEVEDAPEIIGGKAVSIKDRLAYSSVFLLNLESNTSCTGSLIASNKILTAAHCVPRSKDDIQVYFARNPMSENSTAEGVFAVAIDVYPDPAVDLAVVTLPSPAPAPYRPVKIAALESFADGRKVWLVGYGRSSAVKDQGVGRLRKVRMPISIIDDKTIEVNQKSGKGICDGDSGGPVFVYYQKRLQIMGVTKLAYDKTDSGLANCLTTGLFTSLESAEIREWIQELLQKNLVEKRK